MYLHWGRKAQYIVIHPNDSKCATSALNLANIKPQKCLIYKQYLHILSLIELKDSGQTPLSNHPLDVPYISEFDNQR
jgi:hypothetical protein